METFITKLKYRLLNLDFGKQVDKIKESFLNLIKKPIMKYIGALYLLGFFMFGYVLLTNSFTISLGGDFVLQEIPFIFNGHDDWWHYITTAEFPYLDTSGMLSVNNIGANSFYYLFSPWFLISLIFPRAFLPHLQPILTISKMVFSGVIFYYYLNEFGISEKSRKLGGMAFAFCGWQMFYLWFYHFADVAIFLPMILWGIEKVLKEKNPILLSMGLFLCGLSNYFFLVCFSIGGVIYALFRYFQLMKENTFKFNMQVFGLGVLGFAVGIMMVGFILIPAYASIQTMDRVTNASYLDKLFALDGFMDKMNAIFFWPKDEEYKTIYPLSSLLFINTGCFSQTFFSPKGYDNTGCSIFIYTPFTLMIIPSVLNGLRKKKMSYFFATIGICFMLFTPFFYYAFHGFTISYGRWEILVIAFILPCLCKGIDERNEMPKTYLDISVALIIILMAITYLYAYKYSLSGTLNPMNSTQKIVFPLQMLFAFIVYLFLRKSFYKKSYYPVFTAFIALEAIIMANATVYGHSIANYDNLSGGINNVNEETKIIENLNKYDNSFFRVFNTSADRDDSNLAMREGYNGIATFHSVYNFAMQDFLDWSRVPYSYHNWAMGVHEKRYNLETFLGIKYYMLQKTDINIPYGYINILEDAKFKESGSNELKELLQSTNTTHSLYVNQNYQPFGFSYDTLIAKENNFNYWNYADTNEIAYLNYAILDQNSLKDVYNNYNDSLNIGSLQTLTNKIISLNPSETKVSRATWSNGSYSYSPEVSFGSADKENLGFNSYYRMTFNNYNSICPDATSRKGCYVSAKALMGENLDFIFYDKDGNIVTRDTHMTHWYSKTYDSKEARGFYVDRPIVKVDMVIKENLSRTLNVPSFYYAYNDEYQKTMDKQKQYQMMPITNSEGKEIDFGVNTAKFKTNYDKTRFNILSTPYDEGFTLTATKALPDGTFQENNVKLYKAQGGFISFVAEPGDITYTLTYYPRGLSTGAIITFIGGLIQCALIVVYHGLNEDKKIKQKLCIK